MCYDISYLTKRQIDYARRYGGEEDVEDIKKRLPATYHTNGFQHWEVPVITENNGWDTFEWGLIPFWVKSNKDANNIWNKTLNARGETIFDKPAFRNAAKKNRCLVVVDGFFESHHKDGKTFPFYITRKDDQPISLAGIWESWEDKEEGVERYTFSIVTTSANKRMEYIHNNPKLLKRGGPRMPLIISEKKESAWLDASVSKENIQKIIKPFPESELQDHTVKPIRGKNSLGNSPEAIEPYKYAELEADQGNLF